MKKYKKQEIEPARLFPFRKFMSVLHSFRWVRLVHFVNRFSCWKCYSVVLDNKVLEREERMKNNKQDELWAEAVEGWADGKVTEYLSRTHGGYQKLSRKLRSLSEKYPVIHTVVSGDGELKLTEEEHRLFIEYMNVWDSLERLEREYHYYLGLAAMAPFKLKMKFICDDTELPGTATDDRKEEILDLLAKGRMEGSDQKFRSACRKNQNAEDEIRGLEERVRCLGLSEEARLEIDSYVSAVNAQWLEYSEYMYRYGVKDALALLQ